MSGPAHGVGQSPTWLYWLTVGEMHGQAGAIALELGDNARAADYFQRAHDDYDELRARDRATCLIRTGTALVRLGEPDHGYAQAKAGLTIADRIDSTRLADQWSRSRPTSPRRSDNSPCPTGPADRWR